MHRLLLSIVARCCWFLLLAMPLLGQESRSDPSAIEAVRDLAGIQIQEKEGQVIGIDFRKCGDNWIDIFPRVLEISSVQSLSVSGPAATHERIVSLASLPNLRSLRVDQSAINDATVAAIAQFPKIEDIQLDRCLISDESLGSLALCKTIKRIRVPRTKVSDAGLAYIKNLEQLELLDLTECEQISDAGLAHLAGLTKLRILSLSGPRNTEVGMPHLSDMTKLKEFSLFRTRAGNAALATVARARDMTKIKLRDSAITTEGVVEHIGKFPNLIALELSENPIEDAALEEIGKLRKLEDLNLLRTRITDAGVKFLIGCKLKRLNLDDTSVGDAAVSYITQIPTLEFLHLGKTAITDEGLEELKSLPQLKDLILTNTGLSPVAVEQLQKALPKTKISR